MEPPYTLMYVSKAADDFCPTPGIDEIVTASVWWNRSVGITGTLIYSAGHFAQFLEGPEKDVEELFARIRADTRHHDVNLVQSATRKRRVFPRWSLAYAGDAAFIRDELARLHTVAKQGQSLGPLPSRMVQIMYELIRLRAELEPTLH